MAYQIQRKVERCDRNDNPTGNAEREADLAGTPGGAVKWEHFATEPFGFLGRQLDRLRRAGSLQLAFRQDLALLAADGTPQILLPFEHQIRRPAEDLEPVVSGHFAHDPCPLHRSGQRIVDVLRRRFGNGVDDRAIVGV